MNLSIPVLLIILKKY